MLERLSQTNNICLDPILEIADSFVVLEPIHTQKEHITKLVRVMLLGFLQRVPH